MKELLYALPSGMKNAGEPWGLTPAHMAWQIVPGPRLVGVGLTPELRGGAMYVACGEDPGPGDPQPCCRKLLSECRTRGMSMIVCDVEGELTDRSRAFFGALGRLCAQNGLPLCLPECLAETGGGCHVLVSSVVTSGSLERTLAAAVQRYGGDRVVLAVEACAMDFPLPDFGPEHVLDPDSLRGLIGRLEPAIFFDRGLCANYFTYMSAVNEAHFVLFDTPRSVREKLDAAQRQGVSSALLAAPQVEGWLDEIFA